MIVRDTIALRVHRRNPEHRVIVADGLTASYKLSPDCSKYWTQPHRKQIKFFWEQGYRKELESRNRNTYPYIDRISG